MGSNLGPTNKALIERVKGDVDKLKAGEPVGPGSDRPGDDVGQRARPAHHAGGAYFQVPRIAKARNMPENARPPARRRAYRGRTLGLLGEPRVNVLALNLALDSAGTQ